MGEEIVASLEKKTKNLPTTKANAAESNLWNLDSENEISSYVSKQLTASAKKGLAKAKNELTRASQNLISLATTASDVLDGEKHRTKHRRPRSKGGMVSRAMKASSSIWKMLSGATGAAKSFWSKATKWTTDDEGEVKRDQTGNPENIQYLTDYQIEGRSNHDSNDITEYSEYPSWAASPDESPEEEPTNSAQKFSTPDVSFEGQEFVYFVPN